MPKHKYPYPLVECTRHGDPLPGFAVCKHVLAGAPVAVRQEASSTQLGAIACAVCKEDHELFGRVAQLSCAHCVAERFGGAPKKPVIFQNPHTSQYVFGGHIISFEEVPGRKGDTSKIYKVYFDDGHVDTLRFSAGSIPTLDDASLYYKKYAFPYGEALHDEHSEYEGNPARRKRWVMFTYEIVTPESAEEGGFAETGIWYRGYRFKADDPGPMEHLASPVDGVDDAVRTIQYTLGAVEPSSYRHFQPRTWYTETDSDHDYRTGAEMRRSAHLYGFTPREEYWVWQKITGEK